MTFYLNQLLGKLSREEAATLMGIEAGQLESHLDGHDISVSIEDFIEIIAHHVWDKLQIIENNNLTKELIEWD